MRIFLDRLRKTQGEIQEYSMRNRNTWEKWKNSQKTISCLWVLSPLAPGKQNPAISRLEDYGVIRTWWRQKGKRWVGKAMEFLGHHLGGNFRPQETQSKNWNTLSHPHANSVFSPVSKWWNCSPKSGLQLPESSGEVRADRLPSPQRPFPSSMCFIVFLIIKQDPQLLNC